MIANCNRVKTVLVLPLRLLDSAVSRTRKKLITCATNTYASYHEH